LRRTNQRAEAREHLQQAVELAQRCGASLLAERAHEELIATERDRAALSAAVSTPSRQASAGSPPWPPKA
jgi:hypothetical protein